MFELSSYVFAWIGVIPAIPAYLIAHTVFKKRFLLEQKALHGLAPAPDNKEVAGKAKGSKKVAEPLNAIVRNQLKWEPRRTDVPLVKSAQEVLNAIVSMSSLQLSPEERHDLEVLSNQTDELLTNFFDTPESVRSLPEVQTALEAQLVAIVKGVDNIHATGASALVRELTNGTEFLKMKFADGSEAQKGVEAQKDAPAETTETDTPIEPSSITVPNESASSKATGKLAQITNRRLRN